MLVEEHKDPYLVDIFQPHIFFSREFFQDQHISKIKRLNGLKILCATHFCCQVCRNKIERKEPLLNDFAT